jgi:hypothetical protein
MKLYWAPLPRQRPFFLLVGSLLLTGGIIGVLHLCGVMLCPLKKYTGIPCFTCGSTRAVFALFHGEFKTAFLSQPLVISLILLLTPLAALYLYTGFVQRRLPLLSLTMHEKRILFIFIFLLILLNWSYILRSTLS